MPLTSQTHIPDTDRDRIVAAARSIFLSEGFRRVTMDDLAASLRMSKKTMYQHFPSKIALVEAVLHDKIASVQAALSATSDAASFEDKLAGSLETIMRVVEEVRPPMMRDLETETPHLFGVIQTARAEMIRSHFGSLLKEGQREGLMRRDIPVPILVRLLIGMANTLVTPSALGEFDITARRGFEIVLGIFLEGASHKPKEKQK